MVDIPDMTGTGTVAVVLGGLIVLSAASLGASVLIGSTDPGTDTVAFKEVAGDRGLAYEYEGHQVVNGNAGVYVADYNNDGWTDLLLVGNESRGPVLFRNDGGQFTEASVLPEAVRERRIHSVLFFDYDNDGWEDLLLLPDPGKPRGGYVSSAGGGTGSFEVNATHPLLLHNDHGTYDSPTVLSRIPLQPFPIGATTADYDGDGCLDVFIYQNGDWDRRTPAGFRNPSTIGNITDDNGAPNRLLAGNCEGSFTDVSEEAGITGERWSLAASFVDLTGDSRPDIHVANDFNEDLLYVNQGDGTFAARRLGDTTDRNGMSSEIGDVNGDGRPDIYVTNIGMASREGADLSKDTGSGFDRQAAANSPRYTKGNQLLVNQGNGTFVDRAEEYSAKRAPFVWGWAAVMADLDNDADLDIVHANNEKSTVTAEGGAAMVQWEDTPPGVWENVGNATTPSYTSLRARSIGLVDMNARGIARLDYDRDGDLDLVAADEAGTVKLFENRVRDRNWVQVRVGESRSAASLGAEVRVTTANGTQFRFANARVDFLSQESRTLHFGLGPHDSIKELRVIWSDGRVHTFEDVEPNRRIRVTRDGDIEPVAEGGLAYRRVASVYRDGGDQDVTGEAE